MLALLVCYGRPLLQAWLFSDLNSVPLERILLEYVHSFAVYQKYLTRSGEMIIFSPRLENYRFSQPR